MLYRFIISCQITTIPLFLGELNWFHDWLLQNMFEKIISKIVRQCWEVIITVMKQSTDILGYLVILYPEQQFVWSFWKRTLPCTASRHTFPTLFPCNSFHEFISHTTSCVLTPPNHFLRYRASFSFLFWSPSIPRCPTIRVGSIPIRTIPAWTRTTG